MWLQHLEKVLEYISSPNNDFGESKILIQVLKVLIYVKKDKKVRKCVLKKPKTQESMVFRIYFLCDLKECSTDWINLWHKNINF